MTDPLNDVMPSRTPIPDSLTGEHSNAYTSRQVNGHSGSDAPAEMYVPEMRVGQLYHIRTKRGLVVVFCDSEKDIHIYEVSRVLL